MKRRMKIGKRAKNQRRRKKAEKKSPWAKREPPKSNKERRTKKRDTHPLYTKDKTVLGSTTIDAKEKTRPLSH